MTPAQLPSTFASYAPSAYAQLDADRVLVVGTEYKDSTSSYAPYSYVINLTTKTFSAVTTTPQPKFSQSDALVSLVSVASAIKPGAYALLRPNSGSIPM
jgi:hypothetical protein